MKTKPNLLCSIPQTLAAFLALVGLAVTSQVVDFHVTTAQELQNALTLAAANGGMTKPRSAQKANSNQSVSYPSSSTSTYAPIP